MAKVVQVIGVAPAQVFAVLSDGWAYSNWVTGVSHVRAVDAGWPAEGSRIHHAAGVWPFVGRDETVVELLTPEKLLVLTARGRPLGEARIVIELGDAGSFTRVEFEETPIAGPGKWLSNAVTESLLARRNVETLARLAAISERRTSPIED